MADQRDAFESAVSRLPYPVFILDEHSRLRAINEHSLTLAKKEGIDELLLQRFPLHPFSRAIERIRSGSSEDHDVVVIPFIDGVRYELIHSFPSPKAGRRWLMLLLRPHAAQQKVDVAVIRKRWSLTAREAEIAAASIEGRTTAEICQSLSISRETFKTHMTRILRKADCEKRSQLVSAYLFDDDG